MKHRTLILYLNQTAIMIKHPQAYSAQLSGTHTKKHADTALPCPASDCMLLQGRRVLAAPALPAPLVHRARRAPPAAPGHKVGNLQPTMGFWQKAFGLVLPATETTLQPPPWLLPCLITCLPNRTTRRSGHHRHSRPAGPNRHSRPAGSDRTTRTCRR